MKKILLLLLGSAAATAGRIFSRVRGSAESFEASLLEALARFGGGAAADGGAGQRDAIWAAFPAVQRGRHAGLRRRLVESSHMTPYRSAIDTEPGTRSQMGCDLLLLLGPLPPATRPAATEKMTRHHAAFHGGVAPWFGTSPRLRAGRIRRGGRRSSPWSTPPRNRGRTSPRRRCRHRLRRGRAVAS